MAENKFINPLFQRTDPSTRPARLSSVREAAPVSEPETSEVSQAPVKFTFYFQPSQLQRLDHLWVRTKLEHRERLNKSEFVRLALDRLMDEYDRDPTAVLGDLRRNRAGLG